MERTRPPNAIFYNRILKTSWYASESAQNKNTSSIEKPPTPRGGERRNQDYSGESWESALDECCVNIIAQENRVNGTLVQEGTVKIKAEPLWKSKPNHSENQSRTTLKIKAEPL